MSKETGKIVVLLAHPDLTKSKANKALFDTIRHLDEVVVYDLYGEDKVIFSADTWREIMKEASALVFQFPLYWLSAPYKVKKWQDEVFTHLSQTPSVQNKPMMVVTTTGSENDAYRSGGRNEFTIDEILRPYEVAALHAGMQWQTPLVVYGLNTNDAENNVIKGCNQYTERLKDILNINNKERLEEDWSFAY